MNNNDAQCRADGAALRRGRQRSRHFKADTRNRESGMIYEANQPTAPGAAASAKMDFSHADAADSSQLNQILWQDRKGRLNQCPRRCIRYLHGESREWLPRSSLLQ
jgi:hypothetical protein